MKLRDIVRESRETYKGDMSGIPVVGLEHLIPEEICFSEYEICSDKTFTKAFHKGQVLFGRRRAYQKKAAIAHVDGVCSGDIMVLEAIPGKVEPSLLPFIIQNDRFFDYAIQHSEGGLSPRVKWNAIANYEFALPSIDEQKVLADKLWAAYKVKESYRQLLSTTDEMLKAKFQEMFGDPFDCNVRSKVQLGSICTLNPRKTQKYDENTKVSFFPMDVVPEDGRSIELPSRLYKEVSKGFTFAEEGDVIFAKITPCMENGKGTILRNLSSKIGFGSTEFHVLRPIENVTTAEYLYVLISLPLFRKEAEKNMTGSGGQRRVPISFISDFFVAKPDFQKQKEFVSIYAQTETTKASLRASIEAIDRVIRSLINQ